jgi:hypothetical protein
MTPRSVVADRHLQAGPRVPVPTHVRLRAPREVQDSVGRHEIGLWGHLQPQRDDGG